MADGSWQFLEVNTSPGHDRAQPGADGGEGGRHELSRPVRGDPAGRACGITRAQLNASGVGADRRGARRCSPGAAAWAVRQPVFALRQVVVDGSLARTSPAHLEAVIREELTRHVLHAEPRRRARLAATRALGARAWRCAGSGRDRLEVTVIEHEPLARWNDDGARRHRGRGVQRRFRRRTAAVRSARTAARDELAERFREFGATLAPLALGIAELRLSPRGGWQLRTSGSAALGIELGRTAASERLARFVAYEAATVGALARSGTRVDYVDLRYRNGFAVARAAGDGTRPRAESGIRGREHGEGQQEPDRRPRHRHVEDRRDRRRGHAEKRLNIIGLGTQPSRGLKKGVVVNIEATMASIQRVLEEAELMADCKITEVYTGIAGSHIRSLNSSGMVAIKEKEVTQADIDRVVETAKAIAIPNDQQILHILPQEFIIDGQEDVREPLGMSGVRLEVKVHIVTGAVSAVENIIKCVRRCGLEVKDVMLQPLASALAVLNDDEKELGVCLIDIGGGTTDLAVFTGGAIRHTAVIPIAGDQVTNDIAMTLRTPTKDAEELKFRHGCALRQLADPNDIIEVPGVGERGPRKLSRQTLAEVIEPRIEELYTLVQAELRRSGFEELLSSGIVLTGGSALLAGHGRAGRGSLPPAGAHRRAGVRRRPRRRRAQPALRDRGRAAARGPRAFPARGALARPVRRIEQRGGTNEAMVQGEFLNGEANRRLERQAAISKQDQSLDRKGAHMFEIIDQTPAGSASSRSSAWAAAAAMPSST